MYTGYVLPLSEGIHSMVLLKVKFAKNSLPSNTKNIFFSKTVAEKSKKSFFMAEAPNHNFH